MPSNSLRLSALPNQVCNAVIGGQSFVIELRQLGNSLFSSVSVDGVQITRNVRATHGGGLTPWPHAGVKTQLTWQDTKGTDAPQYEGLGDRWLIVFEAD